MGSKRLYFNSLITKFVIVALSFLDTIIINRVMDVSMRGHYGVATNAIMILNLIFCLSIGSSYLLYYKQGEHVKKLFITLITLQNLGYILLTIICFVLTKNNWIFVILIIASFSIMRDNTSSISLIENIVVRNIIYAISNVVYTIILIYLWLSNASNLYYFLFALLFRYLFEISLSFIVGRYLTYFSFKSILNKHLLKTIFENSIAISVIGVLIVGNYNVDIIMMKWLKTDAYNIGLYSVAATLVNIVWIVPDAFKDVVVNRLSRFDAIGHVKKSITINILISSCILIGFILLGKKFITIFYGSKYIESYLITIVLLIGGIPMVFYKLINPYLLSIGKKYTIIIFLSTSVIMNIISNYYLIPQFKEYGAAISSVVSYSICGLLFLMSFIYQNKKNKTT